MFWDIVLYKPLIEELGSKRENTKLLKTMVNCINDLKNKDIEKISRKSNFSINENQQNIEAELENDVILRNLPCFTSLASKLYEYKLYKYLIKFAEDIGWFLTSHTRWNEYRYILEMAIDAAEKLKMNQKIANFYIGIGESYRYQNKFDDALAQYKNVLRPSNPYYLRAETEKCSLRIHLDYPKMECFNWERSLIYIEDSISSVKGIDGKLLKAETCYGYEEYDLGIYCYDENWDPAIVKGVIEEDVFDWVYHYHLDDPQFNQYLGNEILQLLRNPPFFLNYLGVEGPSFMPTVTHFWDADNGINSSTFLHGEMVCVDWSLYTENAYTKVKRYFEGYENNDPYWRI